MISKASGLLMLCFFWGGGGAVQSGGVNGLLGGFP